MKWPIYLCCGWFLASTFPAGNRIAIAGDLTVRIPYLEKVTYVGAIARFDRHGELNQPVDPKATIDVPAGYRPAQPAGSGQWHFKNLPPGRYDLVLLAEPRIRIEGFHYPPVLEFDPVLVHEADAPESYRRQIAADIAQGRHYENKVTPLYFAGDPKSIRVLVQLLRDKPTSYDGEAGEPIATLRHEVWQYTNQYGGWIKEKRTKVLDRILVPKRELRRWTWIWTPQLGAIDVTENPVAVELDIHMPDALEKARGLVPY